MRCGRDLELSFSVRCIYFNSLGCADLDSSAQTVQLHQMHNLLNAHIFCVAMHRAMMYRHTSSVIVKRECLLYDLYIFYPFRGIGESQDSMVHPGSLVRR